MAEPHTYSGDGQTATIADPDNITRDECLALARCGAEAWNKWRGEFPARWVGGEFGYTNVADFSEQDLRNTPVDLSGFVFGDGATFEKSLWGDDARFSGAQWGRGASFLGAKWGDRARFIGAQWDRGASFCGTRWGQNADFGGRTWVALQPAYGNRFERQKTWAEARGLNPGAFVDISFAGAEFEGSVSFQNRQFTGRTDFGVNLVTGAPVRFGGAPEFHGCTLHQNISFDGAVFPLPNGSLDAARAYRTLKLAFAQQQATREEQRFFKLEMGEEAKAAEKHRDPRRWLYTVYREFSEFGFGVARPMALLVAALILAFLLYAWQAGLVPCVPSARNCRATGPLIQFAAAHALPGFEKLAEPASKVLFGDQLGVWTVLTLLLHKAVSILALFLIGLALRNLFKMK
ncbi:pentapeptide repeat-containing protein [Hydrogenophaga sp. A37]|uniref:pentapeptide repeat-containing protein n=1 Tax=Hydrogenophaga sp. A37 TaxID=1945864 RepID=UPI00117B7244|nr:pentapeptide repeat-containing protein [Hydrogenophaga sp. A37]